MTGAKIKTSKSVKETGVNDDEEVLKNSDQPIANDTTGDNTGDVKNKIEKQKTLSLTILLVNIRRIISSSNGAKL